MKRCLVCNSPEIDKHHFKTRGSGGTDDDWNILLLCRLHHTEIHKIGNNRFVEKYQAVRSWLLEMNWNFNEFKKKWVRY